MRESSINGTDVSPKFFTLIPLSPQLDTDVNVNWFRDGPTAIVDEVEGDEEVEGVDNGEG